jgi:hypothetical protein
MTLEYSSFSITRMMIWEIDAGAAEEDVVALVCALD